MSRSIIDRVKTRLEDSDVTVTESLLQDLIEQATDEVLGETQQSELNPALERVVASSVVIKVNRLGTEGLASEGYSGVSTSYLDGLPADLMSIIYAHSRLGSWGDDDA